MKELENHNQEPQSEPEPVLGAEGIVSVPVYTHKEQSRLMTFHNILNRIHDVQDALQRGESPVYGGVDAKGNVVEKYMDLDGKFLYIWNHRLQNMYDLEFADKPEMKEAAENIRDTIEFNHEKPKPMTSGELSELWNRD